MCSASTFHLSRPFVNGLNLNFLITLITKSVYLNNESLYYVFKFISRHLELDLYIYLIRSLMDRFLKQFI